MESKCWFCDDTPGLDKWGYDFSRIMADDSFGRVGVCFPGFLHRDNPFKRLSFALDAERS